MKYRNLHFGPYAASLTTNKDIGEICDLIRSKVQFEPSKCGDVYERSRDLLESNISKGLFTKIARVANDDAEFKALGNQQERIVAITGAYILNAGSNAFHVRIPTETARDRQHEIGFPAVIGTTLAIHDKDLPNADGEFPKRCFTVAPFRETRF